MSTMSTRWRSVVLPVVAMATLCLSRNSCACQLYSYEFTDDTLVDKATAEARCGAKNMILPVIKSLLDVEKFQNFSSQCW